MATHHERERIFAAARNAGGFSIADDRVNPRGHRRNQAIAAARDIRYVRRLVRVIAEDTPEGRHSVIDRVRRDHDARPDPIKQFFYTEDLPRLFGEA